jgi:glycosyltransferase involved in cell wall biosynthesis
MSKLLERIRRVSFDLCLWAQRRRWPLPGALRSVVRSALIRSVKQTNNGAMAEMEEWAHPLIPGDRANEPIRSLSNDLASGRGDIPFALPVRWTALRSDAGVRPRCVVAAGVLDVGGLDRVAALLGRRLPSHGVDTSVVYPANEPGNEGAGERLANALRLEGVPVVKLSSHDGPRWLKAHRPDVISIHGAPDWLLAAAVDAGIPIVETLHGSHSLFEPESWPKERLRSEQINGLVAVSDLVRRQYLRANPGYPTDRITTIPNGVDDGYIIHRDRRSARLRLGLRNEFLFVSLARCHVQKNTFGLVTAFAEVARNHPEAHLLIAGHIHDAAYFEQVRRLRDGLSCAAQIHLRGHSPDASSVLAAADAFVLDSFFEGWSLSSMEALFAGVPVVMSEVGGAREQVGEDGRRGYIVGNPLGDPEAMDWHRMSRARFRPQVNCAALVEAMSAVVRDRIHWRDVRGELRAESVMRFSADRCVQLHADVLLRAAARERVLLPAAKVPLVL